MARKKPEENPGLDTIIPAFNSVEGFNDWGNSPVGAQALEDYFKVQFANGVSNFNLDFS